MEFQSIEMLCSINKIDEFLNLHKKYSDMPVCLYGAGRGLTWYVKFMKMHEISITCIIDKNPWENQVASLEEACSLYSQAIIVVSAPAHREEITARVKSMAPSYFVMSFDPTLDVLHGNENHYDREKYYIQNKEKISYVWNKLTDNISKDTLVQMIKGALTNDCDCYESLVSESQYFPDFIKQRLIQDEIFCDVGAYTGDTIEEFIKVSDNKFKKIIAFEPDTINAEIAKSAFSDSRIKIYENGIGRKTETLYFYNENGTDTDEGAHVVDAGQSHSSRIEVVALDEAINEAVSYIKMDIEGMELEALRGAENLIKKYKPKLAISVYHKTEDIIVIPEYILNLELGYHLYLRHYWNCNGTDTVLFAV